MAQHIHTMSKHDISQLFMQQCSQPKAINKTLIIKLMNPKKHDSNVFFISKETLKTSNSTKIKNTSREILHDTIKKLILRTWTGGQTYNSCVGTLRSMWGWRLIVSGFLYV